jgi:hypothetical protein
MLRAAWSVAVFCLWSLRAGIGDSVPGPSARDSRQFRESSNARTFQTEGASPR